MDIKDVIVLELRAVMVSHLSEIEVAIETPGGFKCPHCRDWFSSGRLIAHDPGTGKYLWCKCGKFYRLPFKAREDEGK